MQKAKMFQDDPMYDYMMSKNKTKTKKVFWCYEYNEINIF